MPRLSRNSGVESLRFAEYRELVIGDEEDFEYVSRYRDGTARDLTGAAVSATAEWITAFVTITGSALAITGIERDTTRSLTAITARIVDAPAGRYVIEVRESTYQGAQPEYDITAGVPACVVAVRFTAGTSQWHDRIVLIWRRNPRLGGP